MGANSVAYFQSPVVVAILTNVRSQKSEVRRAAVVYFQSPVVVAILTNVRSQNSELLTLSISSNNIHIVVLVVNVDRYVVAVGVGGGQSQDTRLVS